jgi:hypothetical protein
MGLWLTGHSRVATIKPPNDVQNRTPINGDSKEAQVDDVQNQTEEDAKIIAKRLEREQRQRSREINTKAIASLLSFEPGQITPKQEAPVAAKVQMERSRSDRATSLSTWEQREARRQESRARRAALLLRTGISTTWRTSFRDGPWLSEGEADRQPEFWL